MATDNLSTTFAALADPTRRAVLTRLSRGETSVSELAKPFKMTLPAVTKHLKVLQLAGLITQGRQAQWRPLSARRNRCGRLPIGWNSTAAFGKRASTGWKTTSTSCNPRSIKMPAEKSDAKNPSSQPVSSDGDFVLTRVFDAPRALVFKCWTDPRLIAQWWGPHGFINPICELDVRPGGSWRIVMRGPDGADHPAKGVYREIVEPERIVWIIDHSDLPDEWHDMVNPTGPRGKRSRPLKSSRR